MILNTFLNTDSNEFIKTIPDHSIDLICTDPPYGINYYSRRRKINIHTKLQNDDNFNIPLDEYFRILKPTGSMFIFYSYKVMFNHPSIKNHIIWVKNKQTAGDLYGDFGNQYESIAFIPNTDFKLHSKRYSNVWHFDKVKPTYHPTEKPTPLIDRIIECATDVGDIVFDPFAGSGTTLLSAMNMNRNYIGCEIDKNYYDKAVIKMNRELL